MEYASQYRWHFQQVHHDIWDYDAPNPVVLFDLEYDGVPRKGLAEFSTDYVSNIITTGLNNMPSFGDLLTNTEICLISEHVRTLNEEIANRNRP